MYLFNNIIEIIFFIFLEIFRNYYMNKYNIVYRSFEFWNFISWKTNAKG